MKIIFCSKLKISFDIQVYDWDRFSKNDLMGEVKNKVKFENENSKWKIKLHFSLSLFFFPFHFTHSNGK